MNFGDLLGLILFLVFIVLPAVNRMQRRGPGAPPGQPGQPPDAPGGPEPRGAATPSTQPFPPLEDDDLARRLAQARERVRQAIEERNAGPAGSASPRAPAPTTAPRSTIAGSGTRPSPGGAAPRPTIAGSGPRPKIGGGVDPRERAARPLVGNDLDDGLLGTPLPQMAAIERASRGPAPARMTMTAHNLRTEAARVELVRLDKAAGRGARSAALLPLDAKSIRDGFVWHQVLGAPRSRRKLGGGPFPER